MRGEVSFHPFKKHFAAGDGSAGQTHAHHIAVPNMVGIGFRYSGTHPSISEIHDGHNGGTNVDYFSLPRRAHRNCAGYRRVDIGVAEPHGSLIFLGDGILEIGLSGLHRTFRCVRLLGARDGGIQVRLRRLHQLLLRLHGRLR